MKKGSYEAVFGHLNMTPDEIGNRMIALEDALRECAGRLTLLIDRDRHKLLDVVARDRAHALLAPTPMFGHIFNAKGGGFDVYITPTESLAGVSGPATTCDTRAQAKAYIKKAGAKPHNF